MSNYHATPYDISASGFYFNNYEEYIARAKNHKNDYGDVIDEVEIQFINGDNYQLFNALGINQANLEQWFNDFEELEGEELIKVIYLAEYCAENISDILDKLDDVSLFEGTATEYAEEYINDCGLLSELPENLRYYFDVEAFARDMVLGGDITEVEIMNTHYIVWGH
ncbi:MAG: antirestriction protein ArdA [Candidatus Marinimicrobia bacterium]|nr:antirestriction protein ArdA [Candidatus Neomarinimicrobiota bacterium]